MTIAYFDCFSGISGDMTLGALVDLGVPIDELRKAVGLLPVQGYSIKAVHVKRCGIGGTLVKVRLEDSSHTHSHSDHAHDHKPGHHHHKHDHDHDHSHDHRHSHEHEHHHHEHEHSHSHASHKHDHPPHQHADHRSFTEIEKLIASSGLSESVKERSIAVFRNLAVAEAAVHETSIDEVHFHEVGAVDAIVDIVGSIWCLEYLGIKNVIASPVAVGSGTVRAAHGEMPIPAPATARLLQGVPMSTGPVSGELTTPTGAAILATVASRFGPLDQFITEKIGYGAGTREYPNHTNYLRVLLGRETGAGKVDLPIRAETLAIITCEIDDMPGELFGHVLEQLFANGCLDAHTSAVQMKKNRPGVSIHVLVETAKLQPVLELLFRETSTFGVRVSYCDRYSLERKQQIINTPLGPVTVKTGYWGNQIVRRTAEYEDCRRLASELKLPLGQVFASVNAYLQQRET